MGREAECLCHWGDRRSRVKALLESNEIVLRPAKGEPAVNALRGKMAFPRIEHPYADGDLLRFEFEGQSITLELGNAEASRWLKTLTSPPATLAKKLGITAAASVLFLGGKDDPALVEALSEAANRSASPPDLLILRVDTPQELASALLQAKPHIERSVPLWIVYPKGSGHALSESTVRTLVHAQAMVDTKVASVSARLTAMRFHRRR